MTEDDIRAFMLKQFELWNARDKEEMFALYKRAAPNGYTIEIVGHPIMEGWQMLNDLWEKDNKILDVEPVEVLANGNEGACYCRNHHTDTGVTVSSIEIYRFDEGSLHVRYFH